MASSQDSEDRSQRTYLTAFEGEDEWRQEQYLHLDLKALHICCRILLDEDLDFSEEQKRRISLVLQPMFFIEVVECLEYDPTIFLAYLPSIPFPSTVPEALHRIRRVNGIYDVDKSIEECTSPLERKSSESTQDPVLSAVVINQVVTQCEEVRTRNLSGTFSDEERFDTLQPVNVIRAIEVVPEITHLIYAPPLSGQRTYKFYHPEVRDVDEIINWDNLNCSRVLTSFPQLIKFAKHSIAIIPSKSVYDSRIRGCGLRFPPSYQDVVYWSKFATQIISTDLFVSEIDPWCLGNGPPGTRTDH